MIANTLSESISAALRVHKSTLQFVSWACLRVIVYEAWGRGPPPVVVPEEERVEPDLRQGFGTRPLGVQEDGGAPVQGLWAVGQVGDYAVVVKDGIW